MALCPSHCASLGGLAHPWAVVLYPGIDAERQVATDMGCWDSSGWTGWEQRSWALTWCLLQALPEQMFPETYLCLWQIQL